MLESLFSLLGDLVLPYVILSFFTMTIVELISRGICLRERILERFLKRMFIDPKSTQELYRHPLLSSLSIDGRKPAYIPARLLALSVVDQIERATSAEDFRQAILKLENPELRRSLEAILRGRGSGYEVEGVQQWFLQVMDQASGLYRVRTLFLVTCVAITLVVPLNFDALMISHHAAVRGLYQKTWEEASSEYFKKHPDLASKDQDGPLYIPNKDEQSKQVVERARDEVASKLIFPIGWRSELVSDGPLSRRRRNDIGYYAVIKLTGLLISILAVIACAPFLFDTLNRFTVIRLAVKPFDRSPEESKLTSSDAS